LGVDLAVLAFRYVIVRVDLLPADTRSPQTMRENEIEPLACRVGENLFNRDGALSVLKDLDLLGTRGKLAE